LTDHEKVHHTHQKLAVGETEREKERKGKVDRKARPPVGCPASRADTPKGFPIEPQTSLAVPQAGPRGERYSGKEE
jgi:hypothetical protein